MIQLNLRRLLDERGMTLYRLAKDTGITYNALHKIAAGKAKAISFDTLDKICASLKCSAGEVLEYRPE